MFDIDSFKSINDRFGHSVGDVVLKEIISTIQNVLRESDFVIRYGGDEFIVILPEAKSEDLYVISERMRTAVYTSNTLKSAAQDMQVSISLGGASYPATEAQSEEELVFKVDNMLYKAKRAGRNVSVIDKINIK